MPGPLFPLQGQNPQGVFDPKQPTLIANFDVSAANGNTLDHDTPYAYVNGPGFNITANSRVDATVTITCTGSATTTDIISITFTSGIFNNNRFSSTIDLAGALTITGTVAAGDTSGALPGIASRVAATINENANCQLLGIHADVSNVTVTVRWNGPIGNFCTLTISSALSGGGAGSETFTVGNSGVMAGGSGPIIPFSNFVWSAGGATSPFWYGIPRSVGYDQITAMVAQGMPIS